MNGVKISLRRDWEAGFNNVHAQRRKLVCELQLLSCMHGASRRLLAIAQRGIEKQDPIG